MKPIYLEMSAFGSYGGVERLDFKQKPNGLFLITGDTGAGKTTIFDAMMYALYGRTSGGERSGSMMRSQFASNDQRTYVRFIFSYENKEYQITRNPEYQIEKTLKNGTKKLQKVAQSVELVLPEGDVFAGKKTETDNRIEELIGLSADQFTQMVMIAQGDFLRLIYAKTEERKKIFSHLFGTQVYYRIEEALKRRFFDSEDQVKMNRQAIEQESQRKIIPPDYVGEENADLLESYLIFGKQKEKELKKEQERLQKRKEELLLTFRQVETSEELFEKARKQYEECQHQNERLVREIEQSKQLLSVSERVVDWLDLMQQENEQLVLSEEVKKYQRQQQELKKKEELWQLSIEEEIAKRTDYETKYAVFLREQAGILAKELAEGKPCPVCGSVTHPMPAKMTDEDVSEEEVNRTKEIRDAAEKKRQTAQETYHLGEQALKQAWEKLSTQTGNLHSQEEIEMQLEQNINTYRRKEKEVEQALAVHLKWSGFIEEVRRKSNRISVKERASYYQQEMEQIRLKLEQIAAECNKNEGTLDAKKQELIRLKTACDETKMQLDTSVVKAGFKDLNHYYDVRTSQLKEAAVLIKENQKKLKDYQIANQTNQSVQNNLISYEKKSKILKEEVAVIESLFKTANGRLSQSAKMDLETFVQRQYFKQIIAQANKRFMVMTNQQFMLHLKEETTGKSKNEGLDLMVYAIATGTIRDIKTLSGGESFLAALSMALGLSDIVMKQSGGIRLDMMFIDEGFGSLDEESRKKAISVLNELSDGKRLIGIISHVTELKEQLDYKLCVTRNEKGSSLCWEIS